MELITILNRCHHFRGFVYEHARFSADQKSIEVAIRPRKGAKAICSRCHQPAHDYDQLAERRFEFIPQWGFSASQHLQCEMVWYFGSHLNTSPPIGREQATMCT